jgi:hypothetical protein
MKTSVSVKITCSLQCSKVPAQGTWRHTKTHEGNRRHLRESVLHLVVHGLPQITHGLTRSGHIRSPRHCRVTCCAAWPSGCLRPRCRVQPATTGLMLKHETTLMSLTMSMMQRQNIIIRIMNRIMNHENHHDMSWIVSCIMFTSRTFLIFPGFRLQFLDVTGCCCAWKHPKPRRVLAQKNMHP